MLLHLLLFLFLLHPVHSTTDSTDVQALQVVYTSLNSPSQLTNWKSNGGDPCAESWKGVTCQGSSVVSLQISGLGLSGSMGYLLSDLTSLKTINLARNNLSGNLPYSLSTMASLGYLNVSGNSLSQAVGDVFTNLSHLNTLDLSFNNFSGDLPASFTSLSNLSTLNVQDNQLTGSLNTLTGLPLTTLNVANNHFNGWIPKEISSIPNFKFEGNSFDNGPAPPPPPFTSPPPGRPRNNPSRSGPGGVPASPSRNGESSQSSKGLSVGAIVGISLGSAFLVGILIVIVFCIRKSKTKEAGIVASHGESRPARTNNTQMEMQEQRMKNMAAVTDVKPLVAEKSAMDKLQGHSGSIKRLRSPMTATSYTVATLQTATNSFSQEFLIGEGSLGRVYRAEFPNGKTMAVKKIDNAALSLQEEDDFLESVSNMSRLRHPNIVSLVGYCVEHGQRLLVYEYIGNGNLHDILHFADEDGKKLNWNARVRVALGTARALEYLHEVCLPSVVHRNFKSANILLDEELNPHLSDCGLAALTPNTERQVSREISSSFRS
ncbi:Protein STRUBBELIG-RECEPTOR FAMILY 8 [Linum perenne]